MPSVRRSKWGTTDSAGLGRTTTLHTTPHEASAGERGGGTGRKERRTPRKEPQEEGRKIDRKEERKEGRKEGWKKHTPQRKKIRNLLKDGRIYIEGRIEARKGLHNGRKEVDIEGSFRERREGRKNPLKGGRNNKREEGGKHIR